MRHIPRFQASVARVGLLFLVCGIAPAPFSRPLPHAVGEHSTAQKAGASSKQPVYNLDVVLYGPFATIDCSEGRKAIRLLAPNVPLHKPVQVGNAPELSKGEYKLLNVPDAKTTTLVNPVQEAGALIFPVEDACPGIVGKPCQYVCIDLPRPKQIVAWDADPMRVLKPGENPATIPWQRLARVLVLRYEINALDGIQLSRLDNNAKWKLQPTQEGTEGIVQIVLDPLPLDPNDPNPAEHEREDSRATFKVLTRLLGLRGHIEFPGEDVIHRYKRNEVLIPDLLPKDLIDSLTRVNAKGLHNDCVLPSVLVMDVPPQ